MVPLYKSKSKEVITVIFFLHFFIIIVVMLITFNTVLTETLSFSFKHYVKKGLKKTVTTEKYDLDL